MVRVNPTPLCCGCLPLPSWLGVAVICFFDLLLSVFIVSVVSSKEPIYIHEFKVEPIWQIAAGAWALIGIPVIIGAGGAALYRIESLIRVYSQYKWGCFLIGLTVVVTMFMRGQLCVSTRAEVERLGSVFVCGVLDSFVLFWITLISVMYLFSIYVVWSAAEMARDSDLEVLIPQSIRIPDAPRKPAGTWISQGVPYAAPSPQTPLIAAPAQYATTSTITYTAAPTQFVRVEAPKPVASLPQTAMSQVYTYTTSTAPVGSPATYTYAPAPAVSYAAVPSTYASQPDYNSLSLVRPVRGSKDSLPQSGASGQGSLVGVPSAAVPLDTPPTLPLTLDPSPVDHQQRPATRSSLVPPPPPAPTSPTLGEGTQEP